MLTWLRQVLSRGLWQLLRYLSRLLYMLATHIRLPNLLTNHLLWNLLHVLMVRPLWLLTVLLRSQLSLLLLLLLLVEKSLLKLLAVDVSLLWLLHSMHWHTLLLLTVDLLLAGCKRLLLLLNVIRMCWRQLTSSMLLLYQMSITSIRSNVLLLLSGSRRRLVLLLLHCLCVLLLYTSTRHLWCHTGTAGSRRLWHVGCRLTCHHDVLHTPTNDRLLLLS